MEATQFLVAFLQSTTMASLPALELTILMVLIHMLGATAAAAVAVRDVIATPQAQTGTTVVTARKRSTAVAPVKSPLQPWVPLALATPPTDSTNTETARSQRRTAEAAAAVEAVVAAGHGITMMPTVIPMRRLMTQSLTHLLPLCTRLL